MGVRMRHAERHANTQNAASRAQRGGPVQQAYLPLRAPVMLQYSRLASSSLMYCLAITACRKQWRWAEQAAPPPPPPPPAAAAAAAPAGPCADNLRFGAMMRRKC